MNTIESEYSNSNMESQTIKAQSLINENKYNLS